MDPDWRWISYWRWGCSIAIFVYQRVANKSTRKVKRVMIHEFWQFPLGKMLDVGLTQDPGGSGGTRWGRDCRKRACYRGSVLADVGVILWSVHPKCCQCLIIHFGGVLQDEIAWEHICRCLCLVFLCGLGEFWHILTGHSGEEVSPKMVGS